jgi:hypothetical protein
MLLPSHGRNLRPNNHLWPFDQAPPPASSFAPPASAAPPPLVQKASRPAAARPAAPGDASGRAGDASGRPAAAPTTRHVDVMCADRCPRAFRFVLSRSRPLHANIGGLVAIEY